MHYYPFNISDYRKDTTHLIPIEHYIYRTLMDTYYLNEQPVIDCLRTIQRLLALNADQQDHIQNVLEDFFERTPKGWVHKRIDDEIAIYSKMLSAASKAGKASAKARRIKASERSLNGRTTDPQPTKNYELRSKNYKKNKTTSKPDRFDEFWDLFDKKVDSKKCKAKWARLNVSEINKVFEVLPNYIKSKPDKQYRKNPLTWLNGEGWNDEIEFKANSVATPQPKTVAERKKDEEAHWRRLGYESESAWSKGEFEKSMARFKKVKK